jgi:anti-sigma28 factor (negative regulator of flagellin synthesis)
MNNPCSDQQPNSQPKADSTAPNESGKGLTAGDRQFSSREERLQAIKKAVEAGEYDSEEIFEAACSRMLQRVISDEDGLA